jgi:hypothetical protein
VKGSCLTGIDNHRQLMVRAQTHITSSHSPQTHSLR